MTRLTPLLLGLLLSPAGALASEIWGEVLDLKHKTPVAEVALVLTSEVLAPPRSLRTDEQGRYVFTDLSPGWYVLRFEKAGFHPYTRTEIPLRLDRKLRVRAELRPLSMPEEEFQLNRPPTVENIACNGGFAQPFIKRLTVERPDTTTATLRPFVSLRPWIPRAR